MAGRAEKGPWWQQRLRQRSAERWMASVAVLTLGEDVPERRVGGGGDGRQQARLAPGLVEVAVVLLAATVCVRRPWANKCLGQTVAGLTWSPSDAS